MDSINIDCTSSMLTPGVYRARTSGSRPNTRSCVTCRARKVRCDRASPCSNCNKAGIPCILPTTKRRKNNLSIQTSEIAARLSKLEERFQLGEGIDYEHDEARDWIDTTFNSEQGHGFPNGSNIQQMHVGFSTTAETENRLLAKQNELSELGMTTRCEEITMAQDDERLAGAEPTDEHQESVLQYEERNSLKAVSFDVFEFDVDGTKNSHPSPALSLALLLAYEENCDPVIKVTHRPTVRNLFMSAANSSKELSSSQEALLFSIYFSAVCTLSPSQCRESLGLEKSELTARMSKAATTALHRARFLAAPSLESLQALVLILIFTRVAGDTSTVWSLTGLAIQIAQLLGLHRDGQRQGLSPFDTEMRRRLWWNILMLDSRFTEDRGSECSLHESFYDATLPLNINDDDMSPSAPRPPSEQAGATEMTFCLVRFALCRTKRQIKMRISTPSLGITRELQEAEMAEISQLFEERYLSLCDDRDPLQWASKRLAKSVLIKLRLLSTIQPLQNELQAPRRDDFLIHALKLIELSHALEIYEPVQKWSWLFRTYVPWHAVAYVLAYLAESPHRSGSQEIWSVVKEYLGRRVESQCGAENCALWSVLQRLLAKASLAHSHNEGNIGPLSHKTDRGAGIGPGPIPSYENCVWESSTIQSMAEDAALLLQTGVLDPGLDKELNSSIDQWTLPPSIER